MTKTIKIDKENIAVITENRSVLSKEEMEKKKELLLDKVKELDEMLSLLEE